MPSLRAIIDGQSAQPLPGKNDVFKNLADVKKKQAITDVAKAKLHTNLAPVKQLIQLVEQLHPLNPPMPTTDMSGNPLPGALPQNMLPQNSDPQGQQNGNKKEELFNKDSQQNPGESSEADDKPVAKKKKTSSGKGGSSKKVKSKADNGKGLSVHIKAGGPGSGRKPSTGGEHGKDVAHKGAHSLLARQWNHVGNTYNGKSVYEGRFSHNKGTSITVDKAGNYSVRDKNGMQQTTGSFKDLQHIMAETEKIDQLNVKGKKRFDYHDNAGLSLQPGRNIGLSGSLDIHNHMKLKADTLKGKVKAAGFTAMPRTGNVSPIRTPNSGGSMKINTPRVSVPKIR